jgi:hypothetical protein
MNEFNDLINILTGFDQFWSLGIRKYLFESKLENGRVPNLGLEPEYLM